MRGVIGSYHTVLSVCCPFSYTMTILFMNPHLADAEAFCMTQSTVVILLFRPGVVERSIIYVIPTPSR